MKKFLKITAAIFLLLLIFFVGLFKYRQYNANQISVPKEATAIIKISMDEIYKSLAMNMLLNAEYYLKSDTNKKIDISTRNFKHGLKIPASVYFYTIKDQPETALFSRFEINQFNDFETFIKNKLGFKILKKQNGITFAGSELGNVIVCYDLSNVAVVVSGDARNFDSALMNVLKENNFQKIGSKFKSLKESTHHIAYFDAENSVTTDFNNGEININADFANHFLIPAAKPNHRKFSKESTAIAWLNADFVKSPNKKIRLKNSILERDSLLKYYKGYLDFEWTNTTTQTDSIITYEYNDDFEKTEKVALQKRSVPNLMLNIKAEKNLLIKYLNEKQVVNLDSGTMSKTVFPLYKVFVGGNQNQLQLTTNKNNKIDTTQIPANEFFSLNVDFVKLNSSMNIPGLTQRLKLFKHLEVKGTSMTTEQIQLRGKVTLNNVQVNALYQILKDF
ncbi:hypothetical protein EV200_10887 [Pedobacter psychrotolerans]|uniref:Uncharacterized protein n=1 Tax=Pedobacter psychrotolerans TaxID=1843235 RepID=A0A4R2H567_9SPHI|nr:hypothetical protein [Pedobacter psychrotolerans]TCO20647.1 hypothetical protein EV200_10887 [Pedobacter psychrotolerans]GGE67057.1 hypothetical protein GCM10011413_37070 [Pedobacter psychrotolerans]